MSLFTFFRAAPGLFESFGFVKQQPVFMSIVLFQLLQGPLDEVSYGPCAPCLIRLCCCRKQTLMGNLDPVFGFSLAQALLGLWRGLGQIAEGIGFAYFCVGHAMLSCAMPYCASVVAAVLE